jgi:hypothetical protein
MATSKPNDPLGSSGNAIHPEPGDVVDWSFSGKQILEDHLCHDRPPTLSTTKREEVASGPPGHFAKSLLIEPLTFEAHCALEHACDSSSLEHRLTKNVERNILTWFFLRKHGVHSSHRISGFKYHHNRERASEQPPTSSEVLPPVLRSSPPRGMRGFPRPRTRSRLLNRPCERRRILFFQSQLA